ncbi:MAG TPA: ZIP family metal transporter [Bacteroidia bacterium]|nr:ZIP family metal transporter [Bacteroidia bacterium]
MNFIQYLLLFFSIVLSGLSFFVFKKTNTLVLKLSLAFTGAFLFAISVLHLIPSVYQSNDIHIGIYVLLGFFIQIFIEFFSEGIEHGHIHVHHKNEKTFPLAMMIGLCLHSYLEGMPLSGKINGGGNSSYSLLTGIILHHIPVAFALMSMLVASDTKKSFAVFYLLLFASMAPLGSLTSQLLNEKFLLNAAVYFDRMMAIVIGIFLHISTTILFESNNTHRFNLYKLFVIVCGAAVAMLMD